MLLVSGTDECMLKDGWYISNCHIRTPTTDEEKEKGRGWKQGGLKDDVWMNYVMDE